MQFVAVEGHLGGNYIVSVNDEEDTEWIEEVCETCFDSDRALGVFDTREEAEMNIFVTPA